MNETLTNSTSPGVVIWCFASISLLIVAVDILIIYILKQTPTLQSHTGNLLINLTVADIFLEIQAFVMIIIFKFVKEIELQSTICYILSLIAVGCHGVRSHSLSIISLNLYFAICHSTMYRVRMTSKYVRRFIPLCWMCHILISLFPLGLNDALFVSFDFVSIPQYKGATFWAWMAIILIIHVLPILLTSFTFTKILLYRYKIQTLNSTNNNVRDKFRLSQLITGISAFYVILWLLIHLFRALQGFYEKSLDKRKLFRNIWLIIYLVSILYSLLKLGIYILVYKPIQNTVARMIGRRNQEVISITVLSRMP